MLLHYPGIAEMTDYGFDAAGCEVREHLSEDPLGSAGAETVAQEGEPAGGAWDGVS